MTRTESIQPHALIELSKPVKAALCSTMTVPASRSWSIVLPVGLRIRVAWDFMPGDSTLDATPETDGDHQMINAAMQDKDGTGSEGYGIRVEAEALEGAFRPIENRRWAPEDMDLSKAGHLRLIVRHLGAEEAWLSILPPSIRVRAQQGLDHLRSGSITNTEFLNEILVALDADWSNAQ